VVSLVALQYDDVGEASRAAARVVRPGDPGAPAGAAALSTGGLAVAWWTSRAPSPSFRPLTTPGSPHVGPAFWGLLFGTVFYLPLIGAALGRTTGTDSDLLADLGIGDTFVNRLRDQLVPGTSALVVVWTQPDTVSLLARGAAHDRRLALVAGFDDAQQAALWEVFGG
jgi:hypothetical protein